MNPVLKKLKPEERESAAYVEWFQLQHPAFFEYLIHVPNERADKVTRIILALLGVKAGVQDFLLFEPRGGFAGMALEMKVAGATLSDVSKDQRRWASRLARQRWFTGLACGLDQAIEITNAYMGERLEERHWFRPVVAEVERMMKQKGSGI